MQIHIDLNDKQKHITRLVICMVGFFSLLLVWESFKATIAVAIVLMLMLRNPTFMYALSKTIKRDIIAIKRFIAMNMYIIRLERRSWSIARILQDIVPRFPNKPCIIMEDRALTFRYVDEYSTRVGSYFRSQGFKHGDCVALLMETRPEYPCIWLGLSKLGVVTALINYNLRGDTLLHSIKVVNPKAIIVGTELATGFGVLLNDEVVKALSIYQFCDEEQRMNVDFQLMKGASDLAMDLKKQPIEDLTLEISACKPKDKLIYVYTSGTTGLPKAAVITNLRYLFMATAGFHIIGFHENDVIYNPLPLYHTAGGIVGLGNSLIHGTTVVLRKKFSASNFWKDCIKYKCTVAQYIGELCRYLLSTPPKPEDIQHSLRLMYGNGLRSQIWEKFVTRFNIPLIGEVYGSTEGNSNLANITNQIGAIGFIPIYGKRFLPVQVIQCDKDSGEPLRDHKGYCIRCVVGETGLLIGKVDSKRVITAFHGYADKEATEKKLLRNVFSNGDCFFNSGDMVVTDIFGYVYFKDRTGDTFRWRGENVSTQEVESIISNVIGLQDCVVYGVEIPHIEGKAGMAAIEDPYRKLDLQKLSNSIRTSLPSYAQPLFLRIMDAIPRTSTFKMKKFGLISEAFDLRKVRDPIYYLNKDGIYQPLTLDQFQLILEGKAGL